MFITYDANPRMIGFELFVTSVGMRCPREKYIFSTIPQSIPKSDSNKCLISLNIFSPCFLKRHRTMNYTFYLVFFSMESFFDSAVVLFHLSHF